MAVSADVGWRGVPQVAVVKGVSEQAVRRACREGRLPGALFSERKWRIPADTAEVWRPNKPDPNESDVPALDLRLPAPAQNPWATPPPQTPSGHGGHSDAMWAQLVMLRADVAGLRADVAGLRADLNRAATGTRPINPGG